MLKGNFLQSIYFLLSYLIEVFIDPKVNTKVAQDISFLCDKKGLR